MPRLVADFVKDERGATAIEYGLIAAVIAIGIVASLGNLRTSYTALYNHIYNGLNN